MPSVPSASEPQLSPRNRQRLRRHVWYAVLITLLALISQYTSLLPVFRDELMRYLGIGDRLFGFLFSVGMLGSLLTVLPGGALTDRLGPRRVIRFCLLGVGLASLLLAGSGTRWTLLALGLGLAGLFSGPLYVATNAYLVRLFPGHQRRVLSLNLAASSAGGVLYPALAEYWLYLAARKPGLGFATVLHAPFVVVGVILLAASFIYRAVQPAAGRQFTWGGLFQGADFRLPAGAWWLIVLLAAHGMADNGLYVWMARFLGSGAFATQPLPPGMVLAGYAVAYLVSRVLLAALPEHRGRRKLLIVPGLAGGALLLAGLLSRDYWLTSAGYVLGAFCWSAEYPAYLGALAHHHRQRFGAALATGQMLTALLGFLSLNGLGLWADRVGDANLWQVMLAPAAVFPLVGLGGWLWALRYDRGTQSDA